jgi:hypothetical protein
LCKICGWIAAQVCFEEVLRLRERDVVTAFALDLQGQIRAPALQKVTATGAIV